MPGMTHWQHPRFFAYFAAQRLAPGDPRRDARRRAQPRGVPVADVARLHRARGRGDRLGRAAARPPRRLARPYRGRRLDLDARRHDRRPPRHGAQRRRRLRARALGGREGRADARAWSCARCPRTASTACAPTGSTSPTRRSWSPPSAPPRPPRWIPVPALADLCAQTGTWLHVDAAYAGRAMVCPEFRWAFDGVERADSLVVNAHKWMLTPMDCSLLWTSRPDGLPRRLQPRPRVPAHAGRGGRAQLVGVRPGARPALPLAQAVGGAALPRPLRAAADDPRARPAGRAVRGAGRGRARLGAGAPSASRSCASARTRATRRTRRSSSESNASGEVFMSHTRLDGRYVLRLAIGSERTTEADVHRAWDVLRSS